jgi:hypothetical protein
MNDPRLQNFAEAYLAMAGEARYRPQAPGDGMGNVCLSTEEAANPERLAREAGAYVEDFQVRFRKIIPPKRRSSRSI